MPQLTTFPQWSCPQRPRTGIVAVPATSKPAEIVTIGGPPRHRERAVSVRKLLDLSGKVAHTGGYAASDCRWPKDWRDGGASRSPRASRMS
jgi:hypothetical protein